MRRLVDSSAVAVLDVLGKVVLLSLLALVIIDPDWGNLAGKAPTARALTYPLLAFADPSTPTTVVPTLLLMLDS